MTENRKEDLEQSHLKKIARALSMTSKTYAQFSDKMLTRSRAADFQILLNQFFLLTGTVFLLVGILSFFAYNWAELHKFAKLFLLQMGLIACVGLGLYKNIDSVVGKIFLMAASVFVGFNLALYGQIYQTGADPYGLFLGWAVLISAWIIVGRQAGLYALFIILSNLALIFYWNQIVSPSMSSDLDGLFGPLIRVFVESGSGYLPLWILALNVTFIMLFEFLRKSYSFFAGHLLTRVAGFFVLLPLTSSAVWTLFSHDWLEKGILILVLFLVYVATSLWYFRFKKNDLLLSAGTILSVIIFTTSLFAKLLKRNLDLGAGTFFFLAMVVLAQTFAAGVWLKKSAESELSS